MMLIKILFYLKTGMDVLTYINNQLYLDVYRMFQNVHLFIIE